KRCNWQAATPPCWTLPTIPGSQPSKAAANWCWRNGTRPLARKPTRTFAPTGAHRAIDARKVVGSPGSPPVRAAMRILVVEDDAAIANAVCEALKRAGHSVDHLADGRQALNALREHAFALVVLDLGLPGAEGGEILRTLRGDADSVPVLVITAREELDERVRALDLGADDYLVKPFALAEFEARVRALLRRRASQGVP